MIYGGPCAEQRLLWASVCGMPSRAASNDDACALMSMRLCCCIHCSVFMHWGGCSNGSRAHLCCCGESLETHCVWSVLARSAIHQHCVWCVTARVAPVHTVKLLTAGEVEVRNQSCRVLTGLLVWEGLVLWVGSSREYVCVIVLLVVAWLCWQHSCSFSANQLQTIADQPRTSIPSIRDTKPQLVPM